MLILIEDGLISLIAEKVMVLLFPVYIGYPIYRLGQAFFQSALWRRTWHCRKAD
jgi:hypothetical protein